VDKLLAKGFVNRTVCPSNRRKVEIIITETGLKALDQMDKALSEAHKVIFKNFDNKELEQLNTLLDKF